jgi:hypothetical protein
MSNQTIPPEIKKQAEEIVSNFNARVLANPHCYYQTRYRGSYLYLDRHDYGAKSQICRLKYSGQINNWEFAIYKYSDNRYDADEWLFFGANHINGTIEGAMKAGLEAYPP